MSNSDIRTTLLHLRDSDNHDDQIQKLIYYADFRIHHRISQMQRAQCGFQSLRENVMDYILQCGLINQNSTIYFFLAKEGGRKFKNRLKKKSYKLKEQILIKLGKTEPSIDQDLQDKVRKPYYSRTCLKKPNLCVHQ